MFRKLFGSARAATYGGASSSSNGGGTNGRSNGTQATLDAVDKLKAVRAH
jgi:hypothetical protein